MSDLMTLDDVLNGNEVEEVETTDTVESEETPEEEKPEQETTEQQEDVTTDAKEKEPEKESESDSTSEPENTEKEKDWRLEAMHDERRKRQAAEAELKKLKAQDAEKESKQRPDVFDDPEGAFKHTEELIQKQLQQRDIKLSVAMMKRQHEDYEEMESVFVELANENPQLAVEMFRHDLPAEFAYTTAKKHLEYQEMKDLPKYKQKMAEEIEAKIRAEILAEKEADQKKLDAKKAAVGAPSLAQSRSANTSEVVTDMSVDTLFDR